MSKQSKIKRDRKKQRRSEPRRSNANRSGKSQQETEWVKWALAGGLAVVLLVLIGIVWFTAGPGNTSDETLSRSDAGSMPLDPADRNGMYDAPPPMQIDPSKQYFATIDTARGDIVARLFADRAPTTVNNFAFLARQGFYDNTTFQDLVEEHLAAAQRYVPDYCI